ncbi:MAG: Wzz/FepE/Etk N-terminal domain-containing protein [Gammaproteobacteria bacterium]|nr:Wzz/FepE/Etk N-terminal domain-containing protein [Gammaproteobacteria bacterium]
MNIARSDNVLIDRRRPQPAEPLEDDSGINLMEYWRIFRRHWISVIALGIAGYLGALWYANSLTPMYSASVTLVVDPSRGSTGISDPYINYYSQKLFYDTQQTVLMSREIAERTAEKLSAVERERLVTPARTARHREADVGHRRRHADAVQPGRAAAGERADPGPGPGHA